MHVSPYCGMCKSKIETVDHAFCGCKRAKTICHQIFPRVDTHIKVENNFADHLIYLADRLKREDFEKACIAFWTVWNNRNSWLKGSPIVEWPHQCEWIIT